MSLEAALAANTAAVEKLISTIEHRTLPGATPVQKAAGVDTPPGDTKPPKKPKLEKEAAPTVTIKQVSDAGVDLANNFSRDAAVAILTKYGVSRFSELKADQLAGAYADLNAKLDEFKNAAKALEAKPADSLV